MEQHRVKLVATIGPASESKKTLRGLVNAGADALRINLSHTPFEKTMEIVKHIRSISKNIPIIIDTQGKETRAWSPDGAMHLKRGGTVRLESPRNAPPAGTIFVSRADVFAVLKIGDTVTIDDNTIALKILSKKNGVAVCRITRGGTLEYPKNIKTDKKYEPKGMLTERDCDVIKAAKYYGIAEISLSYVASAEEVRETRKFADKSVTITSKIETRKAVQNIDELLKASDAILIDRNDLGTEIGYEKIPLVQKFITARAIRAGKPVSIATHLLESMVKNPKPTRGEVNDIVNLVLDGVSGLVLSSETAVGRDPVRIFKTLKKIAEQGEFVMRRKKSDAAGDVINQLKELNYL